jgi:murein DD-endopeptidase MepM/ murein hydrolase activator NlpD
MSPKVVLIAVGAAGAVLVGGAAPPAAHSPGAVAGPAPGRLLTPVAGAVWTQQFGCTAFAQEPVAPQCPGGHYHSGLDLAAAWGTPVRAAASGSAHVRWDPTGYGQYVFVDHPGDMRTLYGHLSSVSVADGATVTAGQEVGRLGSTGLSTGPHVHFEVRLSGRPVDPATFLS